MISSMIGVKRVKASIRERVWRLLEETNVAAFPRPVYGRIPNFKGAEAAAQRILGLREWSRAEVVKSNPDSPQYYIRLQALRSGKLVIMASPRLKSGFILIDPRKIPVNKYSSASTIAGAFRYGRLVRLTEIPRVDLVVTGCVAVDKRGVRLGKGGGYAELEYGILRELGAIDDSVLVITTIHDLQVVNDEIPLEQHDIVVDYYATPTRLVKIEPRGYKPKGMYWEIISKELKDLGVIRELGSLKGVKLK
ncbi:MAG: 5-formyltetrahydrofolate cyclo-ligase [Desulfurococcaceae archaeon]|nr:5-formyltetrahydrofolate cyclo-ligase [Sulfolobales archaeon]MDW8169954.1 5-formyltetrahydrofolate cyclo-ligase [Desulfurococcaceae archaeon]